MSSLQEAGRMRALEARVADLEKQIAALMQQVSQQLSKPPLSLPANGARR